MIVFTKKGFSLLEMSIVVLISGFVMTAVLNLVPIINKSYKVYQDNRKLEDIEKAFYAFVLKNKRLPVPADMSDKILVNTSTFGIEQEDNISRKKAGENNSLYVGMLPAVSLGLSPKYAYDGFGNKIVYAVNINCTKNNGLLKCDTLNSDLITVNTSGIKTKGVIFAIVAQGYNGKYSISAHSSDQKGAKSESNEEMNNSYNYFIGTVYDEVYKSKSFDDTIIYGTKDFVMTKLSMYDIGCVVDINDSEVIGKINSKCAGTPNFSEDDKVYLTYRDTIKSDKYEYNEKHYECHIECGSYGNLNYYNTEED